MTQPTIEQLFSRQEQAVVYLFSRYWDKIDLFRNKRISRIHTHFPDFALEDIGSNEEEWIEFEYGLSSFASHIPGDLRKLKKNGVKTLYIIYWDDDIDRADLCSEIAKYFKGKLILVCLKDYFSPAITPEAKHLRPGWIFSQRHQSLGNAYSFDSFTEDENRLLAGGKLKRLDLNEGLYRTAGFDTEAASFVELEHWTMIHLFLTGPFAEYNIPSKLFLKPKGRHCFSGYFEIDHAFHIVGGGKPVKEFFRQYYFFPYKSSFKEKYTCLVYTGFVELTYDQGCRLYEWLKGNGYALGQSSQRIKPADVREIDKIAGLD